MRRTIAIAALVLLPTAAVAEVPFHNPGLDYQCGKGFQWSRDTVACEQADCPAGAGRTYTLECNCGEAWSQPYRTCFHPEVGGLATHCVPVGTPCEQVEPGFDPIEMKCTEGFVQAEGIGCVPNPSDAEVACKNVTGARWDRKAATCACADGFTMRDDKSACDKVPPATTVTEVQKCTKEQLDGTNEVYKKIEEAKPQPEVTALHQKVGASLAKGTAPPLFAGIVAPDANATVMKGLPPAASEAEMLDATARAHIDEVIGAVAKGEPPTWVTDLKPTTSFLRSFGAAVLANAPDAIKKADECTRAKYVYGLGLPILDKQFKLRQIDGSSFLGGCGVLASRRGLVRITNATGVVAFDAIARTMNAIKGRPHSRIDISPEQTLTATGQGTCGEWAYGLAEVMRGAGLRATVIVGYKPGWGELINHAGAAIECERNGVVERRVCDAWYLGHDNQRDNLMYWYGHMDGAATSRHNCMPMEDWRADQQKNGLPKFFNPDRIVESPDDWVGDYQLTMAGLRARTGQIAAMAATKGWDLPKLQDSLRADLNGLRDHERKPALAAALTDVLANVSDATARAKIEGWIAELKK